ncbi:hypothetical protein QBC35DRAFT_67565 [Podospora australis]|uniref:Uncharacterized protein n=1 Tax=Podospora australis TaxID=1536484 RepID=A0AAN6WLI2_9PEZI|nr:hypothetical protein QBC35DRAFT_67565 [Podospora australis]
MKVRNIIMQPGENAAWETLHMVQERTNVPTKHNPEPLVRLTATGRYSDKDSPFDAPKVTIAGMVRLAKYCRSSEWGNISRFEMVQRAAFQWLNQADLDEDAYWHHYYNVLFRKNTALANKFLLDVTLLKWQDDVDGLVLRAKGFQESLHEASTQACDSTSVSEMSIAGEAENQDTGVSIQESLHEASTHARDSTLVSERPMSTAEEAENQGTGVSIHKKCDCAIGDDAATQIRSRLIHEIPDAKIEIGQMSDLTLSQFAKSDHIGIDRRSLFEIYTELWRAWEYSSTFQAESKGGKRMSVCIGADLDLHCLGDIDFKIKVERSRGLDMASKFRIPIHTCTHILDSRPWETKLSANTPESSDEESSTITVDSRKLENNMDLYFYVKIIHVSRPIRVIVVEGQAVIVRNARELCWVWAPTGHCPTSAEVPKGLHIEVINATIRKEDI